MNEASCKARVKGVFATVLITASLGAADYYNTFEEAAIGSLPTESFVLDGRFSVQDFQGNHVLELPGSPLETFGVLFGSNTRDGVAVSARIHGTANGRRYPAFAVSLGGVSGYRLQVAPAKRAVELLRGDEVLKSVPWKWKSGEWTHLLLSILPSTDGTWQVQGKVWSGAVDPPTEWTVALAVDQAPVSGKAGVWGQPFAGTPIRFDDLRLEPLIP